MEGPVDNGNQESNAKPAGYGPTLGGGCSAGRDGLLERVNFQIKNYESKLSALKHLKARIEVDPELEDVLEKTRHIVN